MCNEDYDPHLHREVTHGLSNFAALVHLLKGAIGTGILALPEAFKNAGYIFGTVITLILAVLITYCMHMLINIRYIICKKHKIPSMTYAESVKYAFRGGPHCLSSWSEASAHVVNVIFIIYQTGVCSAYVNFIAQNLKKVLSDVDVDLHLRIYMLLIIIPLILMNCIRNLKYLAPFSLVANVFTITGIAVVLYYVLRDGLSFEDRRTISSPEGWPLFFGTVFFAFQSIGTLIPVEYKAIYPKDFKSTFGVMNIASLTMTILYVWVGFSGYIKYGDDTKGSITLNLPQGEFLATLISVFYTLAIFVSHPLTAYLSIEILTEYTTIRMGRKSIAAAYIVRISFVLLTVLVAIAIPNLGLIISLTGALTTPWVSFVIPALMEMCVKYEEYGIKYNYYFFRDIFVIFFGFLGIIAGIYAAIRRITN